MKTSEKRNAFWNIASSSAFVPLVALALVVMVVSLTTPRFLDFNNLSNIALQVSIVAIVAIGATFVIISGGIDLSPGSIIALTTMFMAVSIKWFAVPLPIAIVATIAVGCLLGAVNGTLVAYLRIPPFITTLATLSIFRGIAFLFNDGAPIFSLHPVLEYLFYGRFLNLPLPLYYLVFLFTASWIVARYTRFGRAVYAVGGSANAAKLSGLRVRRIQFQAYVFAGFFAGIGAVLMAARLNSGSPNYGSGLELAAIAAVVVGGATLAGGRGQIWNTLVGALTIVVVQNAMNLNGVPSSAQDIILGIIIVVAISLDMWRNEFGNVLARYFPKKGSK